MKRNIVYILWIFLCLHTTVTFGATETGEVDSTLARVDALISAASGTGIELNAAPVMIYQQAIRPIPQTNFTAWELIHRTPMLQGFSWSGEVANFVTPTMYIGTPIQSNSGLIGYDSQLGPRSYTECVRMETTDSFGSSGALMEKTYEDELRAIAKYCATEFLGTYFSGKSYTTREEMLMLFFTMFEEDVSLPGYFNGTTFISDGSSTQTPFKNISPKAWYAPYLALAREYSMIHTGAEWQVATEASNTYLKTMLDAYLSGSSSIETSHGNYLFGFDNQGMIIEKTSLSPTAVPRIPSSGGVQPGTSVIAPLSQPSSRCPVEYRQDAYYEVSGYKLDAENLGCPLSPNVNISNGPSSTSGAFATYIKYGEKYYWLYNASGAIEEAKYRNKKILSQDVMNNILKNKSITTPLSVEQLFYFKNVLHLEFSGYQAVSSSGHLQSATSSAYLWLVSPTNSIDRYISVTDDTQWSTRNMQQGEVGSLNSLFTNFYLPVRLYSY